MKKTSIAVAIFTACFGCVANASPITSLQTTVVPMPKLEFVLASGTVTQAPGITWKGDGGIFGFTGDYSFGTNGVWVGTPPFAAIDKESGSMKFSFDNPVYAVGGLINYEPGNSNSPVISIYDSSNNLIESTRLSFSTNGIGQFHGFQLADPLISSFQLSGSFIALRNLTVLASTPLAPVPEPETYAMLLAGLGLMATVARRKRPLP